jgi:F-type H+-transporting ATPase subunit b
VHRFLLLLTLICLPVFLAGAAWAAAEAGERGESWNNLIWRLLNVVLFAGALFYLVGKKAAAFFTNRATAIAQEIASLEARKLEAARNLEAIGQRLGRLEEERRAILAEYEGQGQALKEAIVAQAEKAAAQILSQARASARNEINAAMDALRSRMAEEIAKATERLLLERLTPAEHARIIDSYLAKVVIH